MPMLALRFPEFELHQLRGYIQDIFLVVYPHKILLLDGTCRPDVALVQHYIEQQLSRPMQQLQLVVVSHMHPDHAGGAPHYRRLFGTPILASPFAAHWYRGLRGRVQHLLDTLMGQFVARQSGHMNRRLWYAHRIRPNYEAAPGLPLPGFPDWQVVCTPGHTDHDLSLLHPTHGLLYVGDMVLRLKGKYLLPFPIALPELMHQSLLQLPSLPVQHLLMAHGGLHSEPDFAPIFRSLLPLVHRLPKQFRFLRPFVGITGAIQRARQRFGLLEEERSRQA